MASLALIKWQTFRMKSLNDFDDRQFAGEILGAALFDECLRSYVMLLSAHFQGFCRDLYTEMSLRVASATSPNLTRAIQIQCDSDLKLNNRNADYATIKSDYERFGIDFDTALAPDEPTRKLNKARRSKLHQLNQWRNYCAHYNDSHPTEAGTFGLAEVRDWKQACDEFVRELDRIATIHLTSMGL